MKITDKVQLIEDLIFYNYDIEIIAAELQATNPEKFRIIMSTLLESENLTEEEFYRLYQEIEITDKVDLICKNQLAPRYELQKEIFGMDLNTETELELTESYIEEGAISPVELEDCYYVDEEELNNIYELAAAYQSTCDNTCLFEMIRAITNNPKLLNYIPYSHAQLLGIESLVSKSNSKRIRNQELIDTIETLPVEYLTYCDFYGMSEIDIDYTKQMLSTKIDLYLEDLIRTFPRKGKA